MKTFLLLLLALNAAREADGFILDTIGGIFQGIIDLGTTIMGNMFDWGVTSINKFVDTSFNIGGSTLGFIVDPFGWWKSGYEDHGHEKGEVPKCPARADILFVIDTSGSVSERDFGLAKQFATRLTEHVQIGDKDVRFAAITFSDRVQRVFDFKTYSNHAGLSLGLALAPFLGGGTKTYLALDFIRQQNLFSTSNGARERSSKLVVVITDASSDSLFKTKTAADSLHSLYHVISVGIGSGQGWELYNIASSSENVFTADSFANLVKIEQRVARRLCEIPAGDGNIPTADSKCQTGLQKDPKNPTSCIDIDECKTGHSCQQTCTNTLGSYRCGCRAGFVINPNDTSKCLQIRQCTALVDIIFVLDASGSMGSPKFKTQQTFVAKLTHHFTVGPNGALFGGLLFSTDVEKLFDLKNVTSRTDVTTSLLGAPYLGGGTNTHLALKYIDENKMFSPASGGRSNAQDALVIVTDGDASQEAAAKAAADALKSQGVKVFAVGIGEQVNLKQLINLASDSKNVVGSVDFDLLDYIEEGLAEIICKSVGG